MTDLKQKSILVVEDDPNILSALSTFLESEGYRVLIALNGSIALELLKKDKVPNLVLLDMMMPVMNGWQFALEFVARFDHLCPIVVMTAAADAQKRAEEISAIGWIEKPFDLDRLLALIKKHERKEVA